MNTHTKEGITMVTSTGTDIFYKSTKTGTKNNG